MDGRAAQVDCGMRCLALKKPIAATTRTEASVFHNKSCRGHQMRRVLAKQGYQPAQRVKIDFHVPTHASKFVCFVVIHNGNASGIHNRVLEFND